MKKDWENLMLDDDRPRQEFGNQLPVGPESEPKRRKPGNRWQDLATDLQGRCKLPPNIDIETIE